MVDRKRKKNVRMRGSKTHGYGSMKKHRGAGHRGGRGKAGSGKRADSKKPCFWNTTDASKVGFDSKTRVEYVTINCGHLSSIADSLVRSGHAITQGDAIVINLRELGYTKLLGAGAVSRKLKVGVAVVAPSAKAKIEAAGGSVDADTVSDKEAVLAARKEKKTAKGKKE